jgi:anti-sigma B factor antagonist
VTPNGTEGRNEASTEDADASRPTGSDGAAPAGPVNVERRDGVVVISLAGEHDISTAARIRAEIAANAAAGRGVVVSVSRTDFVDSSIVHELFRGDRVMLAAGRRLVLHLEARAIVERVLEMGGVLGELVWTVSLPEAVERARRSSGEA